jgi:hypothetical protein
MIMFRQLGFLAVLALGASSLYAQEGMPVKLGVKIGVPVTDMFSASNTSLFNGNLPGSTFSSTVPRYEVGASAEFRLPYKLRLEVDGLYKRGGFSGFAPYGAGLPNANIRSTFNQWEIPALFKYNLALGHYRPFVDAGPTMRHISGISQSAFTSVPFESFSSNTLALHNRNSFGAVAGFGITFKKGPFELTPEARYTRWANEAFQTNGLRTNLDQGDVLLGISF